MKKTKEHNLDNFEVSDLFYLYRNNLIDIKDFHHGMRLVSSKRYFSLFENFYLFVGVFVLSLSLLFFLKDVFFEIPPRHKVFFLSSFWVFSSVGFVFAKGKKNIKKIFELLFFSLGFLSFFALNEYYFAFYEFYQISFFWLFISFLYFIFNKTVFGYKIFICFFNLAYFSFCYEYLLPAGKIGFSWFVSLISSVNAVFFIIAEIFENDFFKSKKQYLRFCFFMSLVVILPVFIISIAVFLGIVFVDAWQGILWFVFYLLLGLVYFGKYKKQKPTYSLFLVSMSLFLSAFGFRITVGLTYFNFTDFLYWAIELVVIFSLCSYMIKKAPKVEER